MPMFLFRGNMHDIAWDDDLLLRFCGNDALARGHEQHLITTMSVHFVTRTRAEVDDAQIEVVARLRREQRLARHRTTREQGSVHGLGWDLAGFMYLHSSILLSGVRAPRFSRECTCTSMSLQRSERGRGHRHVPLLTPGPSPCTARAARFCASRASQASTMASTTLAHSSTGTSIMRPSRGTAAVPAAVPLDRRMIDVPVEEWAKVVLAMADARSEEHTSELQSPCN